MIFPIKHAMETYSEVIPLWSREDENLVGLQKHTSEFVVFIYGFPNFTAAHLRVCSSHLWISQCHCGHPKRVPQSPQHVSRIVKDKHQEALNLQSIHKRGNHS